MAYGTSILSMASSIQFIKGIKEPSVPDVKLTRARDGSSGTAMFTFNQPSVFEASSELGDITGLYLVDDEGTLQTVDVQAKFVNGKPDRIEAKYTMRSSFEWDRRAPLLLRPRGKHAPGSLQGLCSAAMLWLLLEVKVSGWLAD